MCGLCISEHSRSTLSRRSFLGAGVGAATAVAGFATAGAFGDTTTRTIGSDRNAAITLSPGLDVLPRSVWGSDLPPKGPMGPEDTRFLLVHHTASPNSFGSQRNLIRSAYAFHTGSQKRWPDVAYNFFVGPDGTVWEGRAGSLDGPVVASASGGNQGFAQLVCLLGNFRTVTPPAAMQDSLVRLLAYLALRDGLGTWKDAEARFVSRGSDRWRAGTPVTTSTISGHRDMTFTTCPGEAAYRLLPEWRRRVHPVVQAARRRPGLQPAERLSLEAP